MNHIYRIVWNAALGVWQAVGEIGKGRKKGKSHARKHRSHQAALALALFISGGQVYAAVLPEGAQVTAGSAHISTNGNTMNIVQGTDKAAINWQSFNIGANNAVNVQQNNASSVLLNRVVGNEASLIQGMLNANGQVYILNANGVMFTQGAQVNVAGLVASTLNISDADFMAGKTTFSANGTQGSIINLGTITTQDGGYVALLGNQVKNEGIITAQLGTAIMAAGDKVTLNFNGNSLVNASIDQGTLNALVENKNAIIADGGLVILTAKGLDEVMRTVVNNTGEIRAQTIEEKNGKIYLLGGMDNDRIEVAGKLDASAPTTGDGGFIETSAANVQIKEGLEVSTKAANGQTGEWLIDPTDIYIVSGTNVPGQLGGNPATNSGSTVHAATINSALSASNVTITTASGGSDAGDIHVNAAINWTSNNDLTLRADRNIHINDTISASGASAKVTLEYGQATQAEGNTAFYDFGLTPDGFTGRINLHAGQNFTTKLGSDGTPVNWTVITALGAQGDESNAGATNSLQGLAHSSRLAGNFVLGADIDATATSGWNPNVFTVNQGFRSIGDATTAFTGQFNGLGNTVSNLTINRTDTGISNQGLFGVTNGANLSNIGLVGGSVRGTFLWTGALVGDARTGTTINNAFATTTVAGQIGTGGLVGQIDGGSISNSFATGAVSGSTGVNNNGVGGLAGNVANSTITRSFATGSVNGRYEVGGLVGLLRATSTITESYATGVVSGNIDTIGGLVGWSAGTISNSFATGAANGLTSVGGLVGHLAEATGTITNSYSVGAVGGTASSGGLVGLKSNANSTVTNSYWNTTTSNRTVSAGGVGKTTAEMSKIFTFRGEDSQNPEWDIVAADVNRPYPTLRWTTDLDGGSSVWVMPYAVSELAYENFLAKGQQLVDGSSSLGTLSFVDGVLSFDGSLTLDGFIASDFADGVLPESIAIKIYDADSDLNIDKSFSWSGFDLKLSSGSNIYINADIANANDDKLILEYGQNNVAAGNTSDYHILRNITISLDDGQNFSTKLGSNGTAVDYTVISDAAPLQSINQDVTSRAGNWALGAGIDLDGVNWTPIGKSAGSEHFSGNLAGLGHSVTNLSLTTVPQFEAGLFGSVNNGTIRDLSIVDANFAIEPVSGQGPGNVGVLAGAVIGNSYIKNVHVENASVYVNLNSTVGGLIGRINNNNVFVTRSSVHGNIGVNNGIVGGLIGDFQKGKVNLSHTSGVVRADGSVTIGGIAGSVYDGSGTRTLEDVYSTADIIADHVNYGAGGLIGDLWDEDTIVKRAFASGKIIHNGSSNRVGGAIGSGESDIFEHVYWDKDTTTRATSSAGTGIDNADAYTATTYAGFDFDNVWFMNEGSTRPFLRMEWTPVISNAHQLQLMSMDLAANYTLKNDINLAPSLTNASEMWKDNSAMHDLNNHKGSWTSVGLLTNSSNGEALTGSAFTGRFDGQENNIDGLYIDASSKERVSTGLFGTTLNASLGNVSFTNVDIKGGGNIIDDSWNIVGGTGTLVGAATDTDINNIAILGESSTNNIAPLAQNFVGARNTGGIVGEYVFSGTTNRTLSNLIVNADLSMQFASNVGGIIGQLKNADDSTTAFVTIDNAQFSGAINNTSGSYGSAAGGLIGFAQQINLKNSSIDAQFFQTANSQGAGYVGGAIGRVNNSNAQQDGDLALNTIENVEISGAISGREYVGGLVGEAKYTDISDVTSNAVISWTYDGDRFGGLVGYGIALNITDSLVTGDVTGGDEYVGGLVGELNRGTITSSHYTTGTVTTADTDSDPNIGGLIGYAQSGIVITDSSVTGNVMPKVDTPSARNGGLIGQLNTASDRESKIINSFVSGQVGSEANPFGDRTGGLIGYVQTSSGPNNANVEIIDSSYRGPGVYGRDQVGGLIGSISFNSSGDNSLHLVSGSYNEGFISGRDYVGGLIGDAINISVSNHSYSTGNIVGTNNVGGLFGRLATAYQDPNNNYAEVFGVDPAHTAIKSAVSDSHAAGDVTASGYFDVDEFEFVGATGGLVGEMIGGSIRDSYATGAVQAVSMVGGLAGKSSESTITDSYATGAVTATGFIDEEEGISEGRAGGLVGEMRGGSITRSYAEGNVIGTDDVGGLVGELRSSGEIANSHASGNVQGDWNVGGLAGRNRGSTIIRSYATGDVTGDGPYEKQIGGLVGLNSGEITESYATGHVTGAEDVGGLIGGNYDGDISRSFATGSVTGVVSDNYENIHIGGLIGSNHGGAILDSYATGDVSGATKVGGLVGYNYGYNPTLEEIEDGYEVVTSSIRNSYAVGAVMGTTDVGGLVGDNTDGFIYDSFWDIQTSGQSAGVGVAGTFDGVSGKTTAQMKRTSIYNNAEWDIATPLAGFLYPTLIWSDEDSSSTAVWQTYATALTVNDRTIADKTYDGTTAGNVTVDGFSGFISDVDAGLSVVAQATYDSKDAGSNRTLTINYAVSADDSVVFDPMDFILPTAETVNNQTIAKKQLTFGTVSKVYDTTIGLSGSDIQLLGLVGTETLDYTATANSKNVIYNDTNFVKTMTLSNGTNGGLASNYSLPELNRENAPVTITPYVIVPYTIIYDANGNAVGLGPEGVNVNTKVYDGTNQATVAYYVQYLLTDPDDQTSSEIRVSSIGPDMSTSSFRFNDKNVGSGKTATGNIYIYDKDGGDDAVALGNYTFADGTTVFENVTSTGEITPKEITAISGLTAQNKEYDATTAATINTGSATFNGMIAGDDLSVASEFSAEFDTANAGANKQVSISYLALAGTDASNYTLTSTTSTTTANIIAKLLTLSGAKVYDGNTNLTVEQLTLSGFVGNETVGFSGATANSKNVGSGNYISSITLTDGTNGGLATNYRVVYDAQNSLVTITPKAISIDGTTVANKVYDGNTLAQVIAGVLSGMVEGEAVAVSATGSFDNANPGSGKRVSVTYTLDNDNYSLASALFSANITQDTVADNAISGAISAAVPPTNANAVRPVVAFNPNGTRVVANTQPAGFANVVAAPANITSAFGQGTPLALISAPRGDEPTQVVTITQARSMIGGGAGATTNAGTTATGGANSAGSGAGGAEDEREVRVPVSRNSLAQIVNGGVKLPGGVDQQLFVVNGNQ